MLILGKRVCDEHCGYSLSLVFSLHRDLGRHVVDFCDIPDKVRYQCWTRHSFLGIDEG